MKKACIIILIIASIKGYSQRVHANAHAHNDYVHNRPLFNALKNGFTSIEADVHLINGALIVSHDHPVSNARTLEELYLKPIDSIAEKNGGRLYKSYDHPVILMIDIKTDAGQSFTALLEVLKRYKKRIYPSSPEGAIQIVVSGNRPKEMIASDNQHLTSIDGRPEDIGKGYSESLMPVISDSYSKVTGSQATHVPTGVELKKIKELAGKVHRDKKKLRLWAIPDDEASWHLLLDAGVDIINSDKLEELNAFLNKQKL